MYKEDILFIILKRQNAAIVLNESFASPVTSLRFEHFIHTLS